MGQFVGGEATIDATLVLKSPLPQQSKFYVKLPTGSFYVHESDPTVLCSINSSSLASCLDTKVVDDSRGSYLKSVVISTGSRSYFEGDRVVIRLRNLRNKFDSAKLNGPQLSALI